MHGRTTGAAGRSRRPKGVIRRGECNVLGGRVARGWVAGSARLRQRTVGGHDRRPTLKSPVGLIVSSLEGKGALCWDSKLTDAVDAEASVLANDVITEVQGAAVHERSDEVLATPNMSRLEVPSKEDTGD